MSYSIIFKAKGNHILDLPLSHPIGEVFKTHGAYDEAIELTEFHFATAKERCFEKIDFATKQIRIYKRILENLKDREELFAAANYIEDYEDEIKEAHETLAQIKMLAWIFESCGGEMEIEIG